MNTQLHDRKDGGPVPTEQEAGPVPAPDIRSSALRIDVDSVTRHVAVRGRGQVAVLRDVSFAIGAGELVAIVGPSGAGKTMVLETVAGVAPAAAGSVRS